MDVTDAAYIRGIGMRIVERKSLKAEISISLRKKHRLNRIFFGGKIYSGFVAKNSVHGDDFFGLKLFEALRTQT